MNKGLIGSIALKSIVVLIICFLIWWVYLKFQEANKIKEVGKEYAVKIAKITNFNYRYDQINNLCSITNENIKQHDFNGNIDHIISAATHSCIKELHRMKNYLK